MQTINRIERMLCVWLLSAIVGLVFIAAIMRTLGYPIIWSVDMAQLLFAWLTMLAANQTFHHGQHASVDILTRRLSASAKEILFTGFDILMVGVLLVLLWFGIELFMANPQRKLGSTTIAYRWVTLSVPVGAGLMIITLTHRVLSRHHREKQEAGL